MKNIKLRYYLRGLGIGILVTAFILGIAGKEEKTSLTDAQIREKAIELGMVDGKAVLLSELQESGANESEPSVQKDIPSEDQQAEPAVGTEEQPVMSEETMPGTEPASESTSASENESTNESAPEPESEQSSEESASTITLTIRSGASSYGVSKDLQEAGLIVDAGEFDTYLCNNGYSKSIRVGTYEIPLGTSEEEIAKIITGKR